MPLCGTDPFTAPSLSMMSSVLWTRCLQT